MNPFEKDRDRNHPNRPDLNAELESHLQMSAQDHVSRGADPQSASEAARRELGNLPLIQQTARDHRPVAALFDNLLQDMRFALRTLGKNPGFAIIAVLTLTLGIGANTAIFSVVNAVILHPLPFKNASRLVDIAGRSTIFDFPHLYMSLPDINDVRATSKTLTDISTYSFGAKEVVVDGKPDRLDGAVITESLFPLLGLQPILGRNFTSDDMNPGVRVVILSHKIWRERFASDRTVVGKTMLLDGEQHMIVGVMPAIPKMDFVTDADLWTPLQPTADQLSKRNERGAGLAVAVLGPGATIEQAQRELEQICTRLAETYPDTNKNWSMHAMSLKTSLVGDTSAPLLVLFGAVGFVLLIACANVSNLFLSRGWARRREFAIRSAIGATSGALLRQQLVESTLVALIGGVCALAVAAWLMQGLRALLPPETPRLQNISIDFGVALFTLAASLLAALVAGLAPALLSVRGDVNATIKESGASPSRSHNFLRQSLVVAEVALALTLVIGASLAVQSFAHMLHINAGFRTDHLVTMQIEFPSFRYEKAEQGLHFTEQVLNNTRNLPGVESASAGLLYPMSDYIAESQFTADPAADAKTPMQMVRSNRMEPGFLPTFGIPLLAGRDFDSTDSIHSPKVFIASEAFAKKVFGTANVVGKRISMDREKDKFVWGTIVGVCGDVRERDHNVSPIVYAPLSQAKELSGIFLAVRTRPNPNAVIGAIQSGVWAIDKTRPITEIKTIEEQITEHNAAPKSQSLLLAIFGALGLLLAIVGVYGVMSYLVSQQTREIGIRIALGADPQNILRMVIARSVKLALIGVVLGLIASFALTRFLSSLLFNTSPTDPLTFTAVAVALVAVAIAASATPARRAMQIDPIRALRHD
ncbi:MAG TPA: ABC transporter permease [Candidatus Sulfotelmatobacter sp.]|nr:ABC transporter permease [Candidatus Sulfotelmatobacter sp.]